MGSVLSPVIHDILPTDILEIIFEEHAKLEWKAPTIDGRVCRLWRQIVLNTPRAWARLEIRDYPMPSMGEVRLRLHRSGAAPLHVDTREAGWSACENLYDLLSGHHKRIASLRTRYGSQTFFEGRDFPCIQLLDLTNWPMVVPLSELAPLKMLFLSCVRCASVLRHSQSLTKLMLSDVSLVETISGPVIFPSLTYLSLFAVEGLKPYVNAPRLETYHEGGDIVGEPFNIPIPSLVEYAVCHTPTSSLDPAAWHLSFPNIQRLAIRAKELVILSSVTSLVNQPHLLPALQTISVGNINGMSYQIAEGVRGRIASLVLARNEACNGNIALCFESVAPFQVPIFFGTRKCSHHQVVLRFADPYTRSQALLTRDPQFPSPRLFISPRLCEGRGCCCNSRAHFSPLAVCKS